VSDDAPTDDLDVVRRHDCGQKRVREEEERVEERADVKHENLSVHASQLQAVSDGPSRPQLAIYHAVWQEN
jgi:hypothetical protein